MIADPRFFISVVFLATMACAPVSDETKLETDDIELPVFQKRTEQSEAFVTMIESAHNSSEFKAKQNVKFDILLSFGGAERLNATITMATNSSGIKIEKKDGSLLTFDGVQGFVSPDTISTSGGRFALFTWPYFFALPFKLSDPGTVWSNFDGVKYLRGENFDAMKLTFEEGTGDSPKDWYVIYRSQEDHILKYAAYIVTLGQSVREAERDPHAIEYLNYKTIEGIPISHTWTFWSWNENTGIGSQLGQATLSNISFVASNDLLYRRQDHSRPLLK